MDNYLPIGKAASLIGVSIDTLRRWDKTGRLKSVRIDGKNRFFDRKELLQIKSENELIKVSQAADKIGVSVSTLRRYEKRGLISTERNERGERVYKKEILSRLLNQPKTFSNPIVSIFTLVILVLTTGLSTLYLRETIARNRGSVLGITQKIAEWWKSRASQQIAVSGPVPTVLVDARTLLGRIPGTREGDIPVWGQGERLRDW